MQCPALALVQRPQSREFQNPSNHIYRLKRIVGQGVHDSSIAAALKTTARELGEWLFSCLGNAELRHRPRSITALSLFNPVLHRRRLGLPDSLVRHVTLDGRRLQSCVFRREVGRMVQRASVMFPEGARPVWPRRRSSSPASCARHDRTKRLFCSFLTNNPKDQLLRYVHCR